MQTAAKKKQPPKLAYTVEEAAACLGISRASIYNLLRDRKLGSVMIAGRRLIRRSDIEVLLDDLEDEQAEAAA